MKRFSKEANSSRANFRRDQNPALPRMQLLDFRLQLLHSIVLFLACNSFGDLKRAKVVCNIFNNVIKEDIFFKEVDMFAMAYEDWYVPLPPLTQFRLRYLELGNHSAFFIRGLWEYFCNDHLEEGLESIRFAAEKGYDEAKYTYAMILRTMTPHSVSDSPIINSISRDFYTQTRKKINEAWNSIAWGVETPPLFPEKLNLISTAPLYSCKCAPYTPVGYGYIAVLKVSVHREGMLFCETLDIVE